MDAQLLEIRDQQRASWDKFSSGWKKWDTLMMDFLHPVGEAIIGSVVHRPDALILDVAAGTGEPGLTIAEQTPGGKVIITDLSEDMLAIAREHAVLRGITNIETVACDVCELPFPDAHFDVISCRFGFMFFPDMLLAAQELFRVLKPGGRIATSVWNGPQQNFWVTAIGGTINSMMQLPAPPPGAPGMFRCAEPGLIAGLFQQAGFTAVEERPVDLLLRCGDASTYWNMMTEVAAPFVAALSKADAPMRTAIRDAVFQKVAERYPDGHVAIAGNALVISAVK